MATNPSGSGLESPPARFAYFSELLGRRVVDAKGVFIGRLWDLSIRLPEPYPLVRQLWIRPRGPTELVLMAQGEQVESWITDPIRLSARLSELRPSRRKDETEILLRETLLDKQVVDVVGREGRARQRSAFPGRAGEGARAGAHRRRPALAGAPPGLAARGRPRRPLRAAAVALLRGGGPDRLEVRRCRRSRTPPGCASRSPRSRSASCTPRTSPRSWRTSPPTRGGASSSPSSCATPRASSRRSIPWSSRTC